MIRSRRKMEHINLALNMDDLKFSNGLEDVVLIHQAVPELDLKEVNLKAPFLGKELSIPLIINAMTGGIEEAVEINRNLAEVAGAMNIGLAVGSQTIALNDPFTVSSFKVVRKVNPDGVVLANVSASTQPAEALRAVEMIEADGLQLHLNTAQELAMVEGDRCFRGLLDNIKEIMEVSPVPVIAKEVGFGISREAGQRLYDAGVRFIDVGGHGGTNFMAIELKRGGLLNPEFLSWGIPTSVSLSEISDMNFPITVIASGGINDGLQAVKALSLGADIVGVAGFFLKVLLDSGLSGLRRVVEGYAYEMKCAALMAGAANLEDVFTLPLIIRGDTAKWLNCRGIDIGRWANRNNV
ncbi:MAG: type 2 isopentenyl-diphosphate Delta-isomerase [Chitinophagales bacterium]